VGVNEKLIPALENFILKYIHAKTHYVMGSLVIIVIIVDDVEFGINTINKIQKKY
jgi:hypothetical protein